MGPDGAFGAILFKRAWLRLPIRPGGPRPGTSKNLFSKEVKMGAASCPGFQQYVASSVVLERPVLEPVRDAKPHIVGLEFHVCIYAGGDERLGPEIRIAVLGSEYQVVGEGIVKAAADCPAYVSVSK